VEEAGLEGSSFLSVFGLGLTDSVLKVGCGCWALPLFYGHTLPLIDFMERKKKYEYYSWIYI
jgi:hypothetical protein